MAKSKFEFVKATHPVYDACVEDWRRMERLMAGGSAVMDELHPFEWEIDNGDHHKARKRWAVYPKYPDRYASIMVGHLMRSAPEPDAGLNFGSLGTVARTTVATTPTPAELVYYNVDGIGADGSQWDAFWNAVAKMAICTGHRWVLVEGPPVAPKTRREEIAGLRPYVSHHSPIDVINWHWVMGRLMFLVVKRRVRVPIIENGDFTGNEDQDEYLLMVGEGCRIFEGVLPGSSTGQWFTFDKDLERITGTGTLDATEGEICALPIFYERVKPTEDLPQISRSGVQELGNAAIAHMNIDSAADFDSFDSASSVMAVVGADPASFNTFLEKIRGGSRYAPLPPNQTETAKSAEIKDLSTGAVVGSVFKERIDAKRQQALELMMQEIQSAPYASGKSKRATWTDTRAPRLTMMASEMENGQNAVIRWLELLWGRTPSGVVNWPKNFELFDIESASRDFLEMESISGISSPLLDGIVLTNIATRNGFIVDDDTKKKVLAEYATSAEDNKKAKEAEMDFAKARAKVANAPPSSNGNGGNRSQ